MVLLIGWQSEFTLAHIAAMSVRRVSVGGALAGAAWSGFMGAECLIANEGLGRWIRRVAGSRTQPLFRDRAPAIGN